METVKTMKELLCSLAQLEDRMKRCLHNLIVRLAMLMVMFG